MLSEPGLFVDLINDMQVSYWLIIFQARKVNGSENAAQRVKTFTNIYDVSNTCYSDVINM